MNKKIFSTKLFQLNFKTLSLILGICFTMILSISTSILLGKFIDFLQQNKFNVQENIYYILGLFLITVISLICTLLFVNYFPLKMQLEKSIETSQAVMEEILRLPQKDYQDKDSGYYINLVTSSSFTFADIFAQINTQFIGNILCVLILLIISAFINIYFTILFIIYIPIYYIVTQAPTKKISKFQESGLATQDAFLSSTKQIVSDKRSINISKANDYYNESYCNKSNKYLKFVTKYKLFEIISEQMPNILSGILQISTLGLSTYLFYKNQISLGTIILMFQFSSLLQAPVNRCFQILIHKAVNKPDLTRIQEFIGQYKNSGFEKYYKDQKKLLVINDGKFYTTDKKDQLLFEVDNMELEKNSLIIIKGENGSGKSMFVNFITGYSDPGSFTGNISIDTSVKDVAYLSYPILLVSGNLKENLFNKSMKEELINILNIDFENKIIDDKSRNLSFGQQQKLNLLRVLSKDSNVIILDEPFTNLDKETIESLTKYIIGLKGSVTIIAITHSEELDESADYILDIRDKKISNYINNKNTLESD